jgi:hypothetical protein
MIIGIPAGDFLDYAIARFQELWKPRVFDHPPIFHSP